MLYKMSGRVPGGESASAKVTVILYMGLAAPPASRTLTTSSCMSRSEIALLPTMQC